MLYKSSKVCAVTQYKDKAFKKEIKSSVCLPQMSELGFVPAKVLSGRTEFKARHFQFQNSDICQISFSYCYHKHGCKIIPYCQQHWILFSTFIEACIMTIHLPSAAVQAIFHTMLHIMASRMTMEWENLSALRYCCAVLATTYYHNIWFIHTPQCSQIRNALIYCSSCPQMFLRWNRWLWGRSK